MGQIIGVVFIYLIAFFIRKSYISISIAFVIVLLSVFGTMYDPKSADNNLIASKNYYDGLSIFIIDVITFSVFFYIIRKNKQAKLNTGDTISKD